MDENYNKKIYLENVIKTIGGWLDSKNNYISPDMMKALDLAYSFGKNELQKLRTEGYNLDNLSYDEKIELIKQGKYLDEFINDEYCMVRLAVAEQGYGLEKLINDENEFVKCEVARQGYGLDILINDESKFVRAAVANQGYGLDVLINDDISEVRAEVAKQGYGLDVLINDEHWMVRKAVVGQGYGLDKLINDGDYDVVYAAKSWLRENGMTIEEYKEKYPERCVLNKEKELADNRTTDERIGANTNTAKDNENLANERLKTLFYNSLSMLAENIFYQDYDWEELWNDLGTSQQEIVELGIFPEKGSAIEEKIDNAEKNRNYDSEDRGIKTAGIEER